ncbi:MAG: hypothetical protein JWQ20_1214 [Conexibacter sp.]|nr:hypothetical protein [Conexibacter sp.]
MPQECSHGRRELMAPYERPYRHALKETWRHQPELRRASALAVALWLAGSAGIGAGAELLGLLAGLGAMIGTVVVLAWLVAILRTAWRLTRSWRQPTELATVRAHRPQAGTEDPDGAHAEFAVTVGEDGQLVTWQFRPLLISEHPAELEVEVPGRPRYGASPVDDAPFDVHDTVRAAEQLVIAQDRAAQREAAAAIAAHAAMDEAVAHADLAAEARSTAAALQRATGQRSPRD